MYKVLIADDEALILKGISTMVEWEKCRTELIGTALNGEIAYDMIVKDPPDIVITDIKMPGMNGLELLQKVRQTYSEIQFIILSGYEEFEFAKKAMEYGVKHYLLKPCNKGRIADVLEQVVAEIDETRSKDSFMRQIRYDLEKVLPQVKEQFLKEFITCKTYGSRDWEYYSQLFRFKKMEKIRLLLLELEGQHDYEHIFALKNIAAETIGNDHDIILNTTVGDNIVFLIEDQPIAQLVPLLYKIKRVYKEYYNLEITTAVSGAGEIEHVRQLYKEAQEGLAYRFYLGTGCIITKEDVWMNSRTREMPDHEKFILSLRSGNTQEVEDYLRTFFEWLKQQQYDIDLAKSYILDLHMVVIRQALPEDMEGHFKKLAQLYGLETLGQFEQFVASAALEVVQSIFESLIKVKNEIVMKMLQYIHDHLDDESLSLLKLANDIMYMNADYLGRLFKMETGERFSSYISNARIDRAKQLLDGSQEIKVQKVAEMVGFGYNSQYFSTVFKKETGYAPTEYKKRK